MLYGRFDAPPAGLMFVFIFGTALALIVLLFAVLLTLAGIAEHVLVQRQARRTKRDACDPPRCAGCGYDLRASRFRCPECGRAIDLPPPPKPRITLFRGFVLVSSRRGRER